MNKMCLIMYPSQTSPVQLLLQIGLQACHYYYLICFSICIVLALLCIYYLVFDLIF